MHIIFLIYNKDILIFYIIHNFNFIINHIPKVIYLKIYIYISMLERGKIIKLGKKKVGKYMTGHLDSISYLVIITIN